MSDPSFEATIKDIWSAVGKIEASQAAQLATLHEVQSKLTPYLPPKNVQEKEHIRNLAFVTLQGLDLETKAKAAFPNIYPNHSVGDVLEFVERLGLEGGDKAEYAKRVDWLKKTLVAVKYPLTAELLLSLDNYIRIPRLVKTPKVLPPIDMARVSIHTVEDGNVKVAASTLFETAYKTPFHK